MRDLLPKKLPSFSKARVLVVGDVMLDRYWFGDTARISPEAPVPIVKVNTLDNRPGGAANVALNIIALDANATTLGVTGQDEAGNTLKTLLSHAAVGYDFCELAHVETIVKLRVISRHQQLLRLDFENKVIAEHEALLFEKFKQYLATSNLIVLSDYKKGTLTNPKTFIGLANKAHVRVLVDPKSDDFSVYEGAYLITPNFKEFEAVVGKCENEDDIIQKGRTLLKKHHIHALLVTRGEHGMTLIEQDGVTHMPAYAREVFDVTGAGDTVIATLAAALGADIPLKEAMALANLAASIAVSKLGAVAVSTPELDAVLTDKTHTPSGIVNDEQLLQAVNAARLQGKKIVFTNGCYDIIHAGHVKSLEMAKELGDHLIVAVNTDESIKKLKGPERPINNLEHRLIVLAGLNVVDWVIPFSDDTPERLLKLIKPDVLVKGGDYSLNQVVGADIVRAYGGDVRVVQHNIKTSSSSLLEKLKGQS